MEDKIGNESGEVLKNRLSKNSEYTSLESV